MYLSSVISWNEGDSYTVYFKEPVPTSGIRLCGEEVPIGAKSFHSFKPVSIKHVYWKAANGQEFEDHAVAIDISSDSPVKLHISDVKINRANGLEYPCYYCEAIFSKNDSISMQGYNKRYQWEADNGQKNEQFATISRNMSVKVDYSSFSGKVVFDPFDYHIGFPCYIGGIEWASKANNKPQYRLKLYRPTLFDNFAWKYVTKSGDIRYQKIKKNTTVSTLNVDEEVTKCYIGALEFDEDSPREELEIQEVSLLDGSQPKYETLVLWHANGKTTEISLSKKPRVTFSADKVLVKGSGINFEYSANDIVKFTYKKEDVVNDIDAPNNEVNFFRDEEHIVFNGIKSTDEVALYKLNGSRVPVQLTHSDDNKVTLSLSGIPSGIYILKVNGKTTKITKQ